LEALLWRGRDGTLTLFGDLICFGGDLVSEETLGNLVGEETLGNLVGEETLGNLVGE